jgi:hypothetical protein
LLFTILAGDKFPTATRPIHSQQQSPANLLMGGSPKYSVKLRAHNTFALKCRYRPDGLAIATTSADQTTKLWSVTEHNLVAPNHKSFIACILILHTVEHVHRARQQMGLGLCLHK